MGIGITLQGGGLKGVAHIGALQALEELGIKIDYISGTSSGAMIATMYAMGYSPDEIKQITKESYKKIVKIKKSRFIKFGFKFILRKEDSFQGLIDGKIVEDIVNKYANKKEIYKVSDIKTDFAIVTVDAKTTKKCVFVSKDILKDKDVDYISDISVGQAVRASMSFPAVFTPCSYKNYCFIDGGTVDNMPVKLLNDMGATKTIAIGFNLDEFTGKENLFSIILRACDIFSLKDVEKGQKLSDLSIEIDMNQAKLLKINDIDSSIKQGYDEIMKNKEKILGMVEV